MKQVRSLAETIDALKKEDREPSAERQRINEKKKLQEAYATKPPEPKEEEEVGDGPLDAADLAMIAVSLHDSLTFHESCFMFTIKCRTRMIRHIYNILERTKIEEKPKKPEELFPQKVLNPAPHLIPPMSEEEMNIRREKMLPEIKRMWFNAFTCDVCADKRCCRSAFDPFNVGDECLEEK